VVTHRPVALGTNWTEVVNVERTTLAFRQIVAHLKEKWRYDVFAPCHMAFMFEVLVAAIKNPYLLA
jgi:hypothetical protein